MVAVASTSRSVPQQTCLGDKSIYNSNTCNIHTYYTTNVQNFTKTIFKQNCLPTEIKLCILKTSREQSINNVVSVGSFNDPLSLIAM